MRFISPLNIRCLLRLSLKKYIYLIRVHLKLEKSIDKVNFQLASNKFSKL